MELSYEQIKTVFELLSTVWADKYQGDERKPGMAKRYCEDSELGMQFLLENAFSRAGGEQAKYGGIAVAALKTVIKRYGSYSAWIEQCKDTGDVEDAKKLKDPSAKILWKEFKKLCEERKIKPNIKLNPGVIEGLVKLAKQTSKDCNFNPYEKLVREIKDGCVFNAYIMLIRIDGIGEKIATFILRDIVIMVDAEETVARKKENLFFLQPVDRWVKKIVGCLLNLPEETPSWFIAIKIIDECEKYRCSSPRFNQGCWKYGSSEIKGTKKVPEGIKELLESAK